MLWLGIDVGGTFTDLVLYDEATGAIRLEKTPSTPRDHAEGMMTGIGRLAVALDGVARIAHGTTVATNTALERSGARTAVVTTRGFRDVLEVGRGNRLGLYLRGAVSMRRICPLNPADAVRAGFGDGAIVELLGPGGAPLCAWVVVDGAVEAGTVPLDPLGRRVLGVGAATLLHLRPL